MRVRNKAGKEFEVSDQYYNDYKDKLTVVKGKTPKKPDVEPTE